MKLMLICISDFELPHYYAWIFTSASGTGGQVSGGVTTVVDLLVQLRNTTWLIDKYQDWIDTNISFHWI